MARSRDEIVAEMLDSMPETYDKTLGSPFYETQMPTAIQLEQQEKREDTILKNAFYDTADDEHKELIAGDRANIKRKAAVASTGMVKITGTEGAAVTAGIKVASDTVTFTVTETKLIPESGTVHVTVECDTPGTSGNIPVGAIKDFPVTVSGLNGVTNEEAFTNGYAQETIEDMGTRYKDKVQNPATSGNPAHYKQWAKEVPGVGDARVFGRQPTRGSVTVLIINSRKTAASEELCEETKAYIEERRPVGADVYVEPAEELSIDLSLKLTVKDQTKDYAKIIKDTLAEWLANQAFVAQYISYAKLGDMILGVDGVLDYEELTVNGKKSNVNITETQVAVAGGVAIEE